MSQNLARHPCLRACLKIREGHARGDYGEWQGANEGIGPLQCRIGKHLGRRKRTRRRQSKNQSGYASDHWTLKPMAVAKDVISGKVTMRASSCCFHLSAGPLFPRSVTDFTGLPSRLAAVPSEVIFKSVPAAGTVRHQA